MEQQLIELNNLHKKIKLIKGNHENTMIKLNYEVFRTINGYEKYEVSNLGNIRNKLTTQLLKPCNTGKGYLSVSLLKNKKAKTMRVHRLVAFAFLDNPLNKPFIDHIDNQRTNNNLNNLRWVTNQENQFNSKICKINTSNFKGVSWHKRDKRWTAQIKFNGKKIHLGNFITKDEAKNARQFKAKQLYGEFMNKCEL